MPSRLKTRAAIGVGVASLLAAATYIATTYRGSDPRNPTPEVKGETARLPSEDTFWKAARGVGIGDAERKGIQAICGQLARDINAAHGGSDRAAVLRETTTLEAVAHQRILNLLNEDARNWWEACDGTNRACTWAMMKHAIWSSHFSDDPTQGR